MKNFSLLLSILFFLTNSFNTQAQGVPDSTGFEGDHFSLEGAMDLFKNATSIEAFEKQLNQEENHVNNLDLDKNGEIDYIRVEDHMEDDLHAIVLQVQLSELDIQDIAVIEIEKTGKEEAIAQIIGDEEIYGNETIVEPYEVTLNESNESGPRLEDNVTRIIVNVWVWPSVRFIYAPVYRPWRSPWHWGVYPSYWKPWRPFKWHKHHSHVRRHRSHYHVTPHHRVVRVHKVYTPKRKRSVVVTKRTKVVRTHKHHNPKVTKTKTTKVGVKKSNGKVAVGKKTTTKTTAKNKNGKVVKSNKTTTTKTAKKKKNGTTVKTKKKTKTTKVNRGNKSVTKKKTTTKKVRRK